MGDWGEAGKGATGGAIVGGTLGGPAGAVAGGVIGGAMGYFGGGGGSSPKWNSKYNLPHYGSQYSTYGRLAGQYGNRDAPQMADSRFRHYQGSLARMLLDQSRGQGPGQALVRMQAQQAADRGAKQQLAMAQGGAAGGSAMSARNAAMGTAAMQSQVGGQAAMAGLQAQLGAMGQLGQVAQGARGQDLARASGNAGLELQSRGINDAAQLEALRQRLQASQMQQQGQLQFMGAKTGYNQAQSMQPTMGDRLLGAGMGAGSMYLQGGGFGSGGSSQPVQGQGWATTPAYGGSGYQPFNPYAY